LKVYRLPVYDDQGEKLSAEAIYNHLRKLSDEKQSSTLIGHLTADERQHWAPIYEQLASSRIEFECKTISINLHHLFLVPENRNLFDTIENSVLVLCLDEKNVSGKKDQQTLVGLNFFHGGGTNLNTANRWFDKTLQVISIFNSSERNILDI
jgi:carnitine O-acetyltransferase